MRFFIAKINKQDLLLLKELLEAGKVIPVIDRRYPLSGVAEALRYREEGHAQGKVVITLKDINKTYNKALPPTGERGRKPNMISRIWHGWKTPANADTYEALLKEEIFAGIENRHIRGFKGIQLLRRDVGQEVEFVTIMAFDSLAAVREFAGEDYEVAVVPEKARAVFSHLDERSQHYEIRVEKLIT